MKYRKDGSSYIVRIDKGEEVIAKLKEFAEETDLGAGTVTGIGAASSVELGVYSAATGKYEEYPYEGEFEILSLTGNITQMDGRPHVHVHTVVSDGRSMTVGGHVVRLTIGVTCELRIDTLLHAYGRKIDEETNVSILDL